MPKEEEEVGFSFSWTKMFLCMVEVLLQWPQQAAGTEAAAPLQQLPARDQSLPGFLILSLPHFLSL